MYSKGSKALYLKVRNFNAVSLLLNCIGYSLPLHLTGEPTIEFSNAAVRASEVLQYFGWAPTSFMHKSSWYGAAEVLSQLNWKGNPPGK